MAIEPCPRLPTYAQRSASASAELRPRAPRSSWPTSCSVAVWSAARIPTGSRSQTASAGRSAFSRAPAVPASPCLKQRICASSTKIMTDCPSSEPPVVPRSRDQASMATSLDGAVEASAARTPSVARRQGQAAAGNATPANAEGGRRPRRAGPLRGDAETGHDQERPRGALGDQRTDQKPGAYDQVAPRGLKPAVDQQQSEAEKQSCTGREAVHQVHGQSLDARASRA